MSVFHCRCVSCAVMLGTKPNSAGYTPQYKHADAEPQCNVLTSDQLYLWDRNDVLPEDGPAGPKHVGAIFKINFNMRRRF